MNPIRCCVIDDEPLAAKLISSYVEKTPSLTLHGTYQSAADAVCDIIDGKIDLAFLDIEMPQINGMEFAKIIPPTCRIIFTTAYDQYAVQGFRVNAVDYLLKPISYDEFLNAVDRAIKVINVPAVQPSAAKQEFLIVKSEYRLLQIRISDILYIEGMKDYVKIYVTGQPKPVLSLMSMKTAEQILSPDQFLRVHRSFIVNTSHISVIERSNIIIGDRAVPVSDSYRQEFNEYIARLNPEA